MDINYNVKDNNATKATAPETLGNKEGPQKRQLDLPGEWK